MNKKSIGSLIWRILVFLLIVGVDCFLQVFVSIIFHNKGISISDFSSLWVLLYVITLRLAFYFLFEKKYDI